jgi:hypothetical protein
MSNSLARSIKKLIESSCYQIDPDRIHINGTPSSIADKITTEYSHSNKRIQALLINEETARGEMLRNIDTILECKVSREAFMTTVEQVLVATKEYITGVKELSDLLKQDTIPAPALRTDSKAPDTERSIDRH